ncbi:hypothetical protein KJA13_02450 [Patescibacteria group bacterium]|nr:hypothetical protein [Patescibacteria group bacterium]
MPKIVKNALGNFLVICLIFTLVTVWIFSGWPQIWQKPPVPPEVKEVKAAPETLSLYVNTEVSVGVWTTAGTVPYLNAQDQPTNYIYSIGRNSDSGVYGFADTAQTGTINSVYLYIYAYGVASTNFTTYINSTDTGLGPPTSWGWVSVNVSTILTTWDAINAATCYFDRPNTTDNAGVDAAYFYVDYTPAPTLDITAPENVQMPDYTLGGVGYSERNFNADPPALVQVTAEAGFTVTVSSTNLTGGGNTILASDVKLKTDDNPETNPTQIPAANCSGFSEIDEPISDEYSLDSTRTIVTTSSGSGTCDIYPTIKVYISNNLLAAEVTGTLTFTVQ